MLLHPPLRKRSDWKKIFWPSPGELLFWTVWLCFAHYIANESWTEIFKFVTPLFLMSYAVEVGSAYSLLRWPQFFESRAWKIGSIAFWGLTAVSGVSYWLVLGGGWGQLLAFRPDGGGALFVLAFGAIIVFVLWPVYELFERVIKPWSIWTNRHFVGFFSIALVASLYWGGWLAGLYLLFSRI